MNGIVLVFSYSKRKLPTAFDDPLGRRVSCLRRRIFPIRSFNIAYVTDAFFWTHLIP